MIGKWTLAVTVVLTICSLTQIEGKAWWETASFYQIYHRSFMDSDGDGVGDLNGVTAKLGYLKEIGITATWLSPFLTSPMVDSGYDISNFTEVDPLFGTMEDFEALIVKSKEMGLRVILDFVPNHSSDECEWFIKSAARDPEYADYYVWHPGKIVDGERTVPSNWLSVFRGSAWEWHEGRQEYFLHQFDKKQPDFNFRNPKVKEAMNEILLFWLRKGIDGFRIDAVNHAFEIAPDAEGNYPDESRGNLTNDPDDFLYLDHMYTIDQPETPHLVYEWRELLKQFQKENGGDERIIMVEAWSKIEIIMGYYGNSSAEGAQIPFNFQLILYLNNGSNAFHYASLINNWLNHMPAGRIANWVVGNHDKGRVAKRFGEDRIDMLNMLLLTLPGCSVTYNGEEIGMTDVWVPWKDTVDPQACNGPEYGYEYRSRDPARTPFQWNDEVNAGFSTGNSTWLPVSPKYKHDNVKRQRGVSLSHLNIFKQLQLLRAENTMRDGESEIKALNVNILGVKRSLANDYTFLTLINIFDSVQRVNLYNLFSNLPDKFEYVVVSEKSMRRKGDRVWTHNITLLPKEAVVLKSTVKI